VEDASKPRVPSSTVARILGSSAAADPEELTGLLAKPKGLLPGLAKAVRGVKMGGGSGRQQELTALAGLVQGSVDVETGGGDMLRERERLLWKGEEVHKD